MGRTRGCASQRLHFPASEIPMIAAHPGACGAAAWTRNALRQPAGSLATVPLRRVALMGICRAGSCWRGSPVPFLQAIPVGNRSSYANHLVIGPGR